MPFGSNNSDHFAATGMMRVCYLNLKRQTPGSLTLV